jgi:uncharacterized protein
MTVATALAPAARPNRLLGLLQRYPLLGYFVIAYAFTAAYDLLVLAHFPDGPSFPRDFGPSLAALVLTAATAGKPGLKRLLRRLVLWRVPVGWYLFVLLGIPAIYVLGILLVPGALASFTPPSSVGWLVYPGVAGFLAVLVLAGPLFEEPGWRGFALPRMQTRWGPVVGSVILGVLWAVWHFTEYLASPDFAAINGGGLTPRGVAVFVLFGTSFSVIMTWVFNHTRGSVLLAILLHTALNWSQFFLTSELFPAAGTNEEGPLVTFGLTALVLVLATRGRLGYARAGGEAGAVRAEIGAADMKRQVTAVLLAAGTALAVAAASALPAAAATSGSETLSGTIVTSGVSGTRTVISSVLVAKGVFSGVGRIVELPSLPTDPANSSRDDLVFPEGTLHLLSTGGDITALSVDPATCRVRLTVEHATGQITGGTGQFAAATGTFTTGTATAEGLGARDPDGSCSMTLPALHEVDRLASSGTLSF